MPIDGDKLRDQLAGIRHRNGRFERFENGEWVEWPVLRIDRLGQETVKRMIGQRKSDES